MRKDDRIAALAAGRFDEHVVTMEGLGRWRCGRPDSNLYSFRVIAAPGAVIVYGDLGKRVYRHANHDSLEWLRQAVRDPDYLLGKASPPFERVLEEENLRAELNAWVGEPHWAACLSWAFRMIGLFEAERHDGYAYPEGQQDLMAAIVEEEMAEFSHAHCGGSREDVVRHREIAARVWRAYQDFSDEYGNKQEAWGRAWWHCAGHEPPFGGETYEAQGWWHAEALRVFVELMARQEQSRPDIAQLAQRARAAVDTLLLRPGI